MLGAAEGPLLMQYGPMSLSDGDPRRPAGALSPANSFTLAATTAVLSAGRRRGCYAAPCAVARSAAGLLQRRLWMASSRSDRPVSGMSGCRAEPGATPALVRARRSVGGRTDSPVVPARRHSREPLPAFLSAEDRSSVALLRAGGVLRLPSDDDPASIKARQRDDELLCPVEMCGAPEMDAALGTIRRHHFRHRAGTRGRTGHSRETAFHEAKHLLRLWAEQQGAAAVVEGEVRTAGWRLRRADTLATLTTTDGPRRFAFEVQYARPCGSTARTGGPSGPPTTPPPRSRTCGCSAIPARR